MASSGGGRNPLTEDLSRLAPERFHDLCGQLLVRLFPGLRPIDGSGGDQGVDAYIESSGEYFQFYAPKVRIRKEKIARDLEKIERFRPKSWVLLINRELTRTQCAWFSEFRSKRNFRIDIWGPAEILKHLAPHSDLRDFYLPSARESAKLSIEGQRAETITNVVAEGSVTLISGQIGRARPRVYVSGVVANEPKKLQYLKYLARRFNELKAWDVGREMRHQVIYQNYRQYMKSSFELTRLDQFMKGCAYLQKRIDQTKIGRMRRAQGQRLYQEFEDFC